MIDQTEKRALLRIAFGVGLFAALFNLGRIWGVVSRAVELFLPVMFGLLIGFVLNVPVSGFQKMLYRWHRRHGRQPNSRAILRMSVALTLLCLLLVLALLGTLVIPEVARTLRGIALIVQQRWPAWLAMLEGYGVDTSAIRDAIRNFDFSPLAGRAGSLLGVVASAASSTVAGAVTFGFSVVVSVYVLFSKDALSVQVKRMLYAYLDPAVASRICRAGVRIQRSYSQFLTGQFTESIILGLLIFFALLVFRVPYAALVGFITAISAMIPYVGAFISCAVGVLLSLLDGPFTAIRCLVVYQVVQFIENQFIYPHVVGGSVGLSPLWTLVAVFLGGRLFGLVGMILFIPLVAVLYEALQADMRRRLRRKHIRIAEDGRPARPQAAEDSPPPPPQEDI